jgi:hypothetical protein
VPYVLYRDHAAASRWIAEVLGFRETIQFTVPNGGPVGHVELARDGAVIMLGLADNRFGETSSNTLVFVDDVNAACARVPDVGGNVLDEPPTTPGACDRPSSPTRKVIAGNSPSTYATSTPPAGAPNRSDRFPVAGATTIFMTPLSFYRHSTPTLATVSKSRQRRRSPRNHTVTAAKP